MDVIQYKPIGIIHTPFKNPNEAPFQPHASGGETGRIEVYPEFAEGVADLDGFSHVIVLFHLHLTEGYSLKVIPRLDDQLRGVFSTRAPRRPNPIGLSVVRLESVKGNTLYVRDVDMVDGTPLLDLKPYVPETISATDVRIGWLTGKGR